MSGEQSKARARLSMPGQVHKAYKVMLKLIHPRYFSKDQKIPMKILKDAKGIAFITTVKGGFIWSGTLGSGIVIARLPDGTWSGPSSLGVVGMGWGGQVGLSVTDSVIVLNNDIAVKAFAGSGQIKFGGALSVAAGPIGREGDASAHVGDKGVAACYSYSHSRGLFAGVSLQGAIMMTRSKDNAKFYGMPVKAMDIVQGKVQPPEFEDLQRLYEVLKVIDQSKTDSYSFRESDMQSFRDSSGVPFHATPGAKYSSTFADDDDDDVETVDSRFARQSVASSGFQWGQDEDDDALIKAAMSNVKRTDDLEPGWVEVATESGAPYYWHEQSGKTQWEKPVRKDSKARLPPPPPKENPDALPAGWTEVDAGNGKVYYWNEKTNVTQWERPTSARQGSIPVATVAQVSKASDSVPVASVATPIVPPRRSSSTAQPQGAAVVNANTLAQQASARVLANPQAKGAMTSAATTAATKQGVPPVIAKYGAQQAVNNVTPGMVASAASQLNTSNAGITAPANARPPIPRRPSSGPAAVPTQQKAKPNPFDSL